MDPISKKLGEHYDETFKAHGSTPEGVDWGSDEDRVKLRYERMLALVNETDKNSWSLLDVGCGYGGLLEHARKRGLTPEYCGIDISQAMIAWARQNHLDANFQCIDALDAPPGHIYDYVVCNGILTQKLDVPSLEMDAYAQRLIRRMFEISRKGLAFNVMKTKVNFFAPNLYYRNPIELLGWCMSELTPHLKIDHSYPLFEYTTRIPQVNL